jgi:hypothetical protein
MCEEHTAEEIKIVHNYVYEYKRIKTTSTGEIGSLLHSYIYFVMAYEKCTRRTGKIDIYTRISNITYSSRSNHK